MNINHLNWVDWFIIFTYFVFILLIGWYVKKNAKTGQEFFMAGRRNSSWVAGIAFLSANMGALELLGMSGLSYQTGILTAHFYLIGAIPAMLFLGIYMMPFYYSSRIHSVPQYLNLRFNGSTRSLNAVAFSIMTVLMAGINLYAMALVLNIFVGWNLNASMWVSSITIAIYVMLGGLISAIFSEVLQFFLIWAGLLLAVILGVIEIGGWHDIVQRIPEGYVHLWSNTAHAQNNPIMVDWFAIAMGLGFVLAFGYWTTDFLVIQRAFSARDMRSAQMTPVLASFFKMLLAFIVVLAGMIAIVLARTHQMPAPERPDQSLLILIDRYYPHGLLGLGVTALLAGFMSGQSGNISAFNTVFTYDIYRAHIVKKASDRHYVVVGRLATLAGILLSIVTAYWAMGMPTIMDYMQALFSIINAPLFATILLGMFWKRINAKGAFTGLLLGMVIAAIMFLVTKWGWVDPSYFSLSSHGSDMAANFWRAIWAWAITFVITIVVSLMTAKPSEENLKGLVYSSSSIKNAYSNIAWYQKPAIWATLSLIIFIILNILFW